MSSDTPRCGKELTCPDCVTSLERELANEQGHGSALLHAVQDCEDVLNSVTAERDALRVDVERLRIGWDSDISARWHDNPLRAENERLKMALQQILEFDKRSMYERCPDCDYEGTSNACTKETGCKSCPTSKVGDIAMTALSIKCMEKEK